MEISGQGRFQKLADILGVQEVERPSFKSRAHAGEPSDQVEISERAKELQRIKALVEQVDTAGAERADEVRKAMKSGRYNISGQAVADAMLRHVLTDAVI
ncbi:MAG TPA: flagellar biosynthesis anti-sigma factor FlgM [Nitrospiraceae bacterium]|nr:flagellar biosynthesis anti-sigma factor FlgM [Nitrospiraceae bacterium]